MLNACDDQHGDVRKVAIQGVARILASQPDYIAGVVDGIAKDHFPSSALEAILSLPATALKGAQEGLIALFSSESAVLRRIMVREVATAKWLTKEQAINAAQIALGDSDLTVRNLALTTLRLLKHSS